MSSVDVLFQESYDLSGYLPDTLDIYDILYFQCSDALLQSSSTGKFQSPHRKDLELFNPTPDDTNASSQLLDFDMLDFNEINFEGIDFDDILNVESNVIPHISNVNKEQISYDEISTSTIISKVNQSFEKQVQSPQISSSARNSACIRKFLVSDESTKRLRRPLLHEFIRLLLDYNEYSHIAEYIDRKRGIFKLHQPDQVADLWKNVKGRNSDNNMTYDKLARALRYYYGNGIMHPNPGRFTFRFGHKSGFGKTWWPAY